MTPLTEDQKLCLSLITSWLLGTPTNCDHSIRRSLTAGQMLGFTQEQVIDAVQAGGKCDCELLFNATDWERAQQSKLDAT